MKSWRVCNLKGSTIHDVEADYCRVESSGVLSFFFEGPEVTLVRAFSPGYWSQMAIDDDRKGDVK